MRKRIPAILLTICMLLTMLPMGVFAANVVETWDQSQDDAQIVTLASIVDRGSCGTNVSWTYDSDGNLNITGSGAMTDYTDSDGAHAPWYSYHAKVKTVTIAKGVTNIGDCAFWQCYNLTNVNIPDSVIYIGEQAFYYCKSLTKVTIPDSVICIKWGAFYNCNGLTSVNIPDSVESIDFSAFSYCADLTDVTIGNGVARIEDSTFEECSNLTRVTISDHVTYIGEHAFRECDSLTDVYYGGSKEQWGNITIEDDNDSLKNATIHYNEQGEDPAAPFSDVASGKFYYQPVLWAVENGITNGLTATTFAPDETCTRGQVVTFLWRAAGKPDPQSANNPFTDVPSGKFYSKAVLWAVENGIASGITKTTFEPNSPCTRGQVVTFQWRAAGKPDSESASNSFTDVPAGKFYSKAVLWAVENKITSGMTKTTFVPDNICTRGQIVTFLYRQYS